MAEIAGLKLIVPTSATATGAGSSATVSATGKVTFGAALSLSINGCFTSSYDNYLVVLRVKGDSGETPLGFRLRLSGTDASGANYTDQSLSSSGASVTAGRTSSATSLRLFYYTNTTGNGNHVYIYGPNLAQPTALREVSASGAGGALIEETAGTHSLSTAYDGFTYFMSDAASSGALTIYGLAN